MKRSRGLTMMELLLVIAIIAILAAMLFPVFARAREKTRSHSCLMNLANIAMALRSYAHDHEGWYPPAEDDLSPLMPRYITFEQVFLCPSSPVSQIPMGAPASAEIWHPPKPPEEEPALGPMGPGGPPGVVLAQEEPPPGPPVEALPAEEIMGYEHGPYPEGTIFTCYYYRAGRRHNEVPMAPLCADHEPHHNAGANVLFSDGNVKWVHEPRWRELGFITPREIEEEQHPEPPPEPRRREGGFGPPRQIEQERHRERPSPPRGEFPPMGGPPP